MRFKSQIIVWLLLATVAHANADHDDMYRRAETVYQQSLHLLGDENKVAVPKANSNVGKYNARISNIQQNSNKTLEQYFKKQGIDTRSDRSNLFVLVSFSMPDNLIKQYINEAEKYGAHVAIIGLVDNDFIETKSRIGEIIGTSNKGGVIIDPNLFLTYHVESVPAILLTSDEYPCQSSSCQGDKFDIIYGAVQIKFALESFENEGDLKDMAANKLKARQG